MKKKEKWGTKQLREAGMFCLGAVGFLHELVIANAERPFLLTASLALMGLPLVLNGDSYFRKQREE